MKVYLKRIIKRIILNIIAEDIERISIKKVICNAKIANTAKLYSPYSVVDSSISDYSYVAQNSHIDLTEIGKFCSIGPNIVCGWGIHPLNGISTAPIFYSTLKQNGITLSTKDKVKERRAIKIGNDVFIGMNVSILDGVSIGDGAVVGAGAVVIENIPPYAIAVGIPARVVKYRFNEKTIQKLLSIKWWDWELEKLKIVEEQFFDIEGFLDHV